MTKLRPITARELERVLRRAGFYLVRTTKSSHRVYARESDNRQVVVAWHPGDIPRRTLHSIVRSMGLEVEDFEKLR